ncbi:MULTISPECIES: hypothetical protein [Nocardia]|uniref:hypothetical protein n=1 Tax=Nocardia TaxID=1817 RepID=UPI0012E760C4|nr:MULTISPECIES: hypothetical protein [Nocardia]
MSNSFMSVMSHLPGHRNLPEVDLHTRSSGERQITIEVGGILFLDLDHAAHVRDEITRLLQGVNHAADAAAPADRAS